MSKKVLSILLVVFMLVTVISGCSSPTDTPSTPTDSPSDSTDSPDDTPVEPEFAGYPMDAADTKLTWWANEGFTLNAAYASYEDSPFHTGLSEMTGVDIEW
ncbi:MAG: hypothetical protein IMZ47_00405 [Firmicutes bacterium]|nr:hypothetical protein [Bacillota bacterium]